MGSTLAIASAPAAASRGVPTFVRLPLAPCAAMPCVLALFPASIQFAPEAT